MDWLLSAGVVGGNWLLGRKLKIGWVVMFIGAILWIYYALFMLHPAQWGLVPASVANLVISARAFYRWRRDEKIRNNKEEWE